MARSSARSDTELQAAEVRRRIAAAGRELFSAQGYEKTTVEAIAERAGVARRTFFRHFRAKDDVVFPDHDRIAQAVAAHLEALDDVEPLRAVCSGARLVFRSYVDDPEVSIQRYQLTRTVPALRDREIAWVSQYNRLFGGYLRRRMPAGPDGALAAEITAAGVVAAHNYVLRGWLRRGGCGEPFVALEAAFDRVIAQFGPTPETGMTTTPSDQSNVVVAVFRVGDRLDDVMQRISRSL
jgi:AcrR family transcriptional regulator